MQRISLCARIAIIGLALAALAQPGEARDWSEQYRLSLAAEPDALEEAGRAAAHEQQRRPFSKDSWTVESLVFGAGEVSKGSNVDLYGTAVGASYYYDDDFAIRAEAFGMFANQGGSDAWAGGANLHGRWHYFRRDPFTLFFEGGGGMLQASVSIPDGPRSRNYDGTHFNFVATAIFGATYQIADNLHLNGAFRYIHISNARRNGKERNPSIEGIGGHLGLIWTF